MTKIFYVEHAVCHVTRTDISLSLYLPTPMAVALDRWPIGLELLVSTHFIKAYAVV